MSATTTGTTAGGMPTALKDVTAAWLEAALRVLHPTTVVEAVEVESVIWGTATKVFLDVTYGRRAADGPPERLCLKGGFQDEMRAVAASGYCSEARFYRDIRPALGDATPRCWYAGDDPGGEQGLVLIDDLRVHGATFGRPQDPQSVDRVAATLEVIADWHGRTMHRAGVGATPWLTVGSGLFRPVVEGFLSPRHWERYMNERQTAAFNDELRDRERVQRAVHRLWQDDDAGVLSLSHGDPHLGNTYVVGDGPMRFLDWQTVCLAPWADDLAYFLVGVLGVEQRRASERDLLRHYLAALAATGAPTPTFDEAWASYVRHHLHGLMFALCPPEMQTPEVCALMGDRYAAAAIDHGTLAVA